MPERTYGIAHLYGISGSYDNATVSSYSEDRSHLIDDTVVDENGRVIEDRLDDEMKDISIGIILRATTTIPEIGTIIAYDGQNMILKSASLPQEAQGRRTMDLKCTIYENITLPNPV